MEIIYNEEFQICDKMKKMIGHFFKKGANLAEYGITPSLRNIAVFEIYEEKGSLAKDKANDFLNDGWEFTTYGWAAYLKGSLGEQFAKELDKSKDKISPQQTS